MKAITGIAFSISLILGVISCSKDDDIKIEEHDKNRMMRELHVMIDAMKATPMPGDPDHHFAKMMQLHHKGAINMANIVLSHWEGYYNQRNGP
jgi:uncharacterized protein (DUF305 family)